MGVQSDVRLHGLLVLVVCIQCDSCGSSAQRGSAGDPREGDSPHAVMATPVMFSGVNSSPKNQAAQTIVVTSFAMPAMDIGTTPARWMMLQKNVADIKAQT